jgi:hypothetical protein
MKFNFRQIFRGLIKLLNISFPCDNWQAVDSSKVTEIISILAHY